MLVFFLVDFEIIYVFVGVSVEVVGGWDVGLCGCFGEGVEDGLV